MTTPHTNTTQINPATTTTGDVQDSTRGNIVHIRLSDGTIIKSNKPSRRTTRLASGRASRRQANGSATLRAVGGYANDIRAIYAPAQPQPPHPH